MTQFITEWNDRRTMDPYEIGWYIESADEDIYGPASRKSLRQFLVDGVITPNTLVRHCTEPEAKPAADLPEIMNQLPLEGPATAVGDRLPDTWPRKRRDQLALAGDSLPCVWHNKRATLVCVRCHAPYCDGCRAKPWKTQFFFCRQCQNGMQSRRFKALIVDTCLFIYTPLIVAVFSVRSAGMPPGQAQIIANTIQLCGFTLVLFRDALFRGAGIGKRMVGLRVVQHRDGKTRLTFGQACMRWLSQCIPLFNFVDALVPYRDPLLRRYGDRWAGTRVIDTETRLAKDRRTVARILLNDGIQPPPHERMGLTMETFVRLASPP
jgi:uncharacterized RDD family membrane protein YckC